VLNEKISKFGELMIIAENKAEEIKKASESNPQKFLE